MIGVRSAALSAAVVLLWCPSGAFAQHDHSAHAGMDQATENKSQTSENLPPPVPTDHPADRYFPAERMQAARHDMAHMGHFSTNVLRLDELEYRAVDGADGFGWQGEFWTGDDLDRLVIASEGEGDVDGDIEHAEIHGKWRHALDPFFNLEIGLRQDFGHGPDRTHALIGVEGHAPYWIEVEGQLFLSNQGDISARLEASHDWRLTQRVILQPALEANFAAQDVPELGIGAGVDSVEVAARLRYDFSPKLAPYVGISWERRLGGSAQYARAEGDEVSATAVLLGLRAWF